MQDNSEYYIDKSSDDVMLQRDRGSSKLLESDIELYQHYEVITEDTQAGSYSSQTIKGQMPGYTEAPLFSNIYKVQPRYYTHNQITPSIITELSEDLEELAYDQDNYEILSEYIYYKSENPKRAITETIREYFEENKIGTYADILDYVIRSKTLTDAEYKHMLVVIQEDNREKDPRYHYGKDF